VLLSGNWNRSLFTTPRYWENYATNSVFLVLTTALYSLE
jgi:hypothetical protein